MAAYRFVFTDVFTDEPRTGNQLAVFTDARGISDETMQELAHEIGFSETVFVLPDGLRADPEQRRDLRRAETTGEELEHLALAPRQPDAAAVPRRDPTEVP